MLTTGCLDCFCPVEVHQEDGCTQCRCARYLSASYTEALSCADCPFMKQMNLQDNSQVILINSATGEKEKRLVFGGKDAYLLYCEKGYWGGFIPKWEEPDKQARKGRPLHGFMQGQAAVCSDYRDDSNRPCDHCQERAGKYRRQDGLRLLCWGCTRKYDVQARKSRLFPVASTP
jgi:hypothetical protein